MANSPKRKRDRNNDRLDNDVPARSRARSSNEDPASISTSARPGRDTMMSEDIVGVQEPESVQPPSRPKGKAPALDVSVQQGFKQPPEYGNFFAPAGSPLPPKLSPLPGSAQNFDFNATKFAGTSWNDRYVGGQMAGLTESYSSPPNQIPTPTFLIPKNPMGALSSGIPLARRDLSQFFGASSKEGAPNSAGVGGPAHVIEAVIRIPWGNIGCNTVPIASVGTRDVKGNLVTTTENHPLLRLYDLASYCTGRFPTIKRLILLISALGDSVYSLEGSRQLAETVRLLAPFGPHDYEFHVQVGCERSVPELRRQSVEARAWAAFVEWVPSQGFWLLSIQDVSETWGRGPEFVYNTLLANGYKLNASTWTGRMPNTIAELSVGLLRINR